ncbi:MAG TPA: ABC transporter substrate-binding protein [Thermoanaerobaculia bacterium]|nr:ABC transporter substrate-binding protein [Thermoanaerobaculia bacterium]
MRRRSRITALAAVLVIGAGALAVPPAASAQAPVLRVGVSSIPASLDPATALDGPVPFIARQVFDTLVQYREGSSDIEPALATQWTVSRDGLSWSFRLRDGVRFHDGTPLQARHVAESLDRIIVPGQPLAPSPSPAGPRLLRGAPGVVKEVLTPDQRTVQINLVLPYAPLLTVLAHPVFSVARLAAGGTRWIGTGPYAVTEAGPGRIILDANPAYWAMAPRTPRVVLVETPDEARAEAELDARNLDLLLPAGSPLRMQGALSLPGWRIGYLAVQTEKEPYRRKKVRQAIRTALSYPAVTASVEPTGASLQSFLPRGVWGWVDTPAAAPDPAAARRLLGEAGVGQGIAGSLLVDGGIGPEATKLGEAIRAALAAAGVAVTPRVEHAESALLQAQAGRDDLAVFEAVADGGDPHFLLYPLSTSEGAMRGPTATNFAFYRNAHLDDLLIRGSQISFRPERQRVYARAQSFLADELPWMPLYVRLHWAVARPELRNFRLHPSGSHRLAPAWIDTGGAQGPSPAPPRMP